MTLYRLALSISKGKRMMIGTICVNWSIMEFLVQRIIWNLRNLNEKEGREVTGNCDINSWRKMLKDDAKKILKGREDDKKELVSIAGDIKKWQPQRNLLVHAYWSINDEGRLYAVIFREGQLRGPNPMTWKRMEDLNNEILTLISRLYEFLQQGKSVPPS